jgi:hypothetical protein
MIDPEPPELWPPKTIPSDEDYERLAAALRDFGEDQRVNDFIKRLNYLIENTHREFARPALFLHGRGHARGESGRHVRSILGRLSAERPYLCSTRAALF